MKQLVSAAAVLLFSGAQLTAQSRSRLYSRPEVPSQAALDRLNLRMAWRTYVPTDGPRDAISTVQVLEDQILLRMRSGMIVALNPEDGTTQWRRLLSPGYRPVVGLGHNSRSVFAFNGIRLYALDRKTGAPQWEFDPPHAPTAAPAADEDLLFLAQGKGQVYVYRLPKRALSGKSQNDQDESLKKPETGTPPRADSGPAKLTGGSSAIWEARRDSSGEDPGKPRYLWDYEVDGRLEQTPLMAGELLVLADTNGTFFANSKHTRSIKYSFQAVNGLAAPLAQHGEVAYVASMDFTVYALDIESGVILWRFTADRAIRRKPVVTDEDVYVSPEGAGLFRVDRKSGDEIWRNGEAERFLANNQWFVYASDRDGRMLVLDRARGRRLSALDVHDFVVPIANEVTDRVYLAANDGLIVCLHDRRYPKPLRVTASEEKKGASDAEGKALPDKGANKPATPKGKEGSPEK
jgi:outer membrane protein assembly factor BamB